MRHFGNGVGHLQYQREHEINDCDHDSDGDLVAQENVAQEDNAVDLEESRGDSESVRDLDSEMDDGYDSEAEVIWDSDNSDSDSDDAGYTSF
jgi:hypothetical protein